MSALRASSFVILLLGLVATVTAEWQSSEVEVEKWGKLLLSSKGEVKLNLSAPCEEPFQRVSSYYRIEDCRTMLERQGRNVEYSVRFKVERRFRAYSQLPSSFSTRGFEVYLRSDNLTKSDDPRIKELALDLTADAKDPFEKVAKLATWVHQNLEYDRTVEEAKDATWVLEQRRGTCKEFTTLFVALAKAVGIPTRYVSGYIYSDEGFEGHGYAEVYLGEWIPVDPTNFRVGYLDASYIRIASAPSLPKAGDYCEVWGAKILDWKTETSIKVLWKVEAKKFRAEVRVYPSSELQAGDSALVVVELEAPFYAAEKVVLTPCRDEQLLALDEEERYPILKPGSKVRLIWIINVSRLREGYKYVCPLVLNSRLFEREVVELKLSSELRRKPEPLFVSLRSEGNRLRLTLQNPSQLAARGFVVTSIEAKGFELKAWGTEVLELLRPEDERVYLAYEGVVQVLRAEEKEVTPPPLLWLLLFLVFASLW